MQLKFSRQRESIKENLMNRKDHPSADMIYMDMRKIYPSVSLGTIYRNLALLADQGEIIKINASDGSVHYDYDTTPHYHFVCKDCGSISDIYPENPEEMLSSPAGFCGTIEDCVVTYYGRCEKCSRK